jgi:hypothetical protein
MYTENQSAKNKLGVKEGQASAAHEIVHGTKTKNKDTITIRGFRILPIRDRIKPCRHQDQRRQMK